MHSTRAALLRGTPLLAASIAAIWFVCRQTADWRHPATGTFDDLLVAGAAWAMVLGTGWAGAILTAAVLEVASSGRLSLTTRLGCPAVARRALLSALGVVLAGGSAVVAAPVSATPGASVRPLPVPARPTGSAYVQPRLHVEVRPGDSLWQLNRQRAPRAPARELARLVERTYRANRPLIGPDPDLIRPGQRLVLPRRPHTASPTEH
jgi:nucleoid-associated protein YgaU